MNPDKVEQLPPTSKQLLARKLASFVVFWVPFVMIIAFRIGAAIFQPAVTLFMYSAVCLNQYPDGVNQSGTDADNSSIIVFITCDNLTEHAQNVVQKQSTNYLLALKFIPGIATFVMCLYCGAWMDNVGRRLPMMLTCLGGMLAMVGFALIQLTHGPVVIVEIVIAIAFYAVVGPSTLIQAAIDSYLTSRTDAEERTRQLGFSSASTFVGMVAGSLIFTGMADLPFWAMFLCVALSLAITFVLSAYAIPRNNDSGVGISEESQSGHGKKSLFLEASSIYHLENLKATFRTLTRARENNKRRYIWATLICLFLKQRTSEADLILLFVQHAPLNFTKSQYGFLISFQYALIGCVLIFVLPLLLNQLRLSDSIVVFGCGIIKTVGLVLLGFSEQTWMVYVANILTSTYGPIRACLRSIISKLVEPDEIGRCFNLTASFEIVSDLAGVIVFSRFYYLGLSMEDSRFGRSIPFCVMALCHIILAGLALYVYFGVKRVSQASTVATSISYKAFDEADEIAASPKATTNSSPDLIDISE